MTPANILHELRELEFPVDHLLIETLYCKLNECKQEFTLSIRESFDKMSSITATLYYQWTEALNDYYLIRYATCLSYPLEPENNQKQTFYLTRGYPRLTLREAYNLLQGRFVNKDLISTYRGIPYNGWLQLNFFELDSRGDYKVIQYSCRYQYALEKVLKYYPIRGFDDPVYAAELMRRLNRGDLVKVTFVKPFKLEDVYISANPHTKLINLEYKSYKNSKHDETEQYQHVFH